MSYIRNSPILNNWINNLTYGEMREVIYSLIEVTEDSEILCIGSNAPYWEKSGDPLVAGQDPWITED